MSESVEKQKDITLPSKGDLRHILSSNGSRQQPMAGFDEKFTDIVDYIVKITHEIWEERAVGKLYDYYATNIPVYTSGETIFGRDAVIAATIQALAAFPDRRLYAEEVIWGGDEQVGFLSSHRLRHEGTNWGHSEYGLPTNRRVSYQAIADCLVIENRIVEEWLARDTLTYVTQLGLEPVALARQIAAQTVDAGRKLGNEDLPGEVDRLQGQMPPTAPVPFASSEFDIESFVCNTLHTVWNWRLLNRVTDCFAPNFRAEGASARRLFGPNQYQNYVLSLLSPFPDLAVTVDHFCSLQDDERTWRTATRWLMTGTHTGPGIYGEPTGNRIRILGMSHHLIRDGKFVNEWTVFDEFALLKQLLAPK